ncbi:MAG: hypothetical protein ACIAXF_06475 [Phycisphaerales bacterium JB063]
MRMMTKACAMVPALLVMLLLSGPAVADESLLGTWELVQIGENEPEDGQRVAYAFDEATVRVTIEAAGETTSWELAYSVSEGKLTLEPGPGLGDPSPITFSYTVEGEALTLRLESDAIAEQPAIKFARVAAE